MVTRLIATLVVLVLGATGAVAQGIDGMRHWVDVDHGERAIYPQEMVLLRIRARFHVRVTLEKMLNPEVPGARMLPIGRDIWKVVQEDGLPVTAFERTVAIFPERSGPLTIPPFVHHLTIIDRTFRTIKVQAMTAPMTIDVSPAPPGSEAMSWWLPAWSLTATETWSTPPEALDIGRSTRRTITLTAVGLMDDQLPPIEKPAVPGLIVFPGPTLRSAKVGLGPNQIRIWEQPLRERSLKRPNRLEEIASDVDGPVSTVSYTFDIRPSTGEPVLLPAVTIPWFDSSAGVIRTIEIPARTVALKAANLQADTLALEKALGIAPGSTPEPIADRATARLLSLGAGLAAFLAVGLLAYAIVDRRSLVGGIRTLRAAWRTRRRLDPFRRAIGRRDPRAARAEAGLLAARGFVPASGADRDTLHALDAHLYSDPPGPAPDWSRLRRVRFRAEAPTSPKRRLTEA